MNILLGVGIGLTVVIPVFVMGYTAANGSSAPFGWGIAAAPGAVVAFVRARGGSDGDKGPGGS